MRARGNPPLVLDKTQSSRQSGSIEAQLRRQLRDREWSCLRQCRENGELGRTKAATPEMFLVVLRHGPAGATQSRTGAHATGCKGSGRSGHACIYTLDRNRQATVLAKGSVRARLPFSLVKQLQSEEKRYDVRRSR